MIPILSNKKRISPALRKRKYDGNGTIDMSDQSPPPRPMSSLQSPMQISPVPLSSSITTTRITTTTPTTTSPVGFTSMSPVVPLVLPAPITTTTLSTRLAPIYTSVVKLDASMKDLVTFRDRNLLSEALAKGIIRSDLCELGRYAAGVKVITDKKSVSDTILIFAKLLYKIVREQALASPPTTERGPILGTSENNLTLWKNRLQSADTEIVIKASFTPTDTFKNNGLMIELQIYERFVKQLLSWNCTPNIMLLVAYYKCPDFQSTLSRYPFSIRKPITEQRAALIKAYPDTYDYNVLNMLVLERGRGQPFYKWKETKRTEIEWFSVLFQIFYTLECFGEIGFRHNDLHQGNIWIEEPVSPQYFVYFVGRSLYCLVPITAVVKIFDFDRSYAWAPSIDPLTGKVDASLFNTTLVSEGYCKDFGQCNAVNKKGDAFLVLWNLFNSGYDKLADRPRRNKNLPPFLEDWILEWFYGNSRLLDQGYGDFFGIFCRTLRPGVCDPNRRFEDDELSDQEMRPILQMLYKGFPMFLRNLPSYDPRYLPDVFPNVFRLPLLLQDEEINRQWRTSLSRENIVPVTF